jgi:transmembrane 9 superfamily protein 2/4
LVDPGEDDDDDATMTIPYTYSVYFSEETSVEWSRRWELYNLANQQRFSSLRRLAMFEAPFMCASAAAWMLGSILTMFISGVKGLQERLDEARKLRKLRKGRKQDSPLPMETPDGLLEQRGEVDKDKDGALVDVAGWKLLGGDVFRPPKHGYLLAPLVGSGMQLLFVATGLVLLSGAGVLNPSSRGGFINFGLGLFVFGGLLSGYFSARIYKTFGGHDWRKNVVVTAVLFPGPMFAVVFILNLFMWVQAPSTAIPFGTLAVMVALWLGFQLPLVYSGARYGFIRAGSWEHPTMTSSTPRHIPGAVHL